MDLATGYCCEGSASGYALVIDHTNSYRVIVVSCLLARRILLSEGAR